MAMEDVDDAVLLSSVSPPNNNEDNSRTTTTTTTVQQFLHDIPTFTLVDDHGVPFMVVGEDAKVTGYFFTTYNEAQRILQLATRSANRAIREQPQQQQPQETNPWKLARISTVPLDAAVALALQPQRSRSSRNYFQVAAAAHDIDDALIVSGREDLPEGRVPLFYYADFLILVDNNNKNPKTPVYFQKSQLERAFRQAHAPSTPLPACQVTELYALLTTVLTPNNNNDNNNIVLVPPTDSLRRARQCQEQWERSHNKDTPPFVLGQRILVL